MKTTVNECARCGDTHVDLTFERFTRPIQLDGVTYQYYGVCPSTQEPILCAMVGISELSISYAQTQED